MIRLSNTDEPVSIQETNKTAPSTVNTTAPQQALQLADHASSASCWIVFQSNVYDITAFLPRHPGGVNAIAQYCGTTGFEQAFTTKHGTSKVAMFMKVATLIGDASLVGQIA